MELKKEDQHLRTRSFLFCLVNPHTEYDKSRCYEADLSGTYLVIITSTHKLTKCPYTSKIYNVFCIRHVYSKNSITYIRQKLMYPYLTQSAYIDYYNAFEDEFKSRKYGYENKGCRTYSDDEFLYHFNHFVKNISESSPDNSNPPPYSIK